MPEHKLCMATALEDLRAAICGQACWIPTANRRLHSKLVLERKRGHTE